MSYEATVDDGGTPGTNEMLAEWVQRVAYEQHAITEKQIRALIRPKPRWMPTRVWRSLLRRMLVLEERSLHAGSTKGEG